MEELIYKPTYISLSYNNSLLIYKKLSNLWLHNKQYLNLKFNNLMNLIFPYFSLINNGNIKLLNNNNISELFKDNNILLQHYEVSYIFNLINKNNMNILEVNSNRYSSLNSTKYISNKKNIKNNYDIDLFQIYINEKKIKNIKYDEYNILKTYTNYINKQQLLNITNKYDLIFCNIESFVLTILYLEEEQSLNLKFIFLIYSILRLKKNGNLLILYGAITTEQSFQIINNFIPYFEDIIIYQPELYEFHKFGGTFILFKKYKDNFNFKKFEKKVNEIFLKDPTLGNDFKLLNKDLFWRYLSDDQIENYKNNVNIYINDYKINKQINKKLLYKIKNVMNNQLFKLKKILHNAFYTLSNYSNISNSIEKIIKKNNYLRIVASYMKGIELKLIDDNYNNYIKQIIIKMKKKIILTKKISDYITMKFKYNIYDFDYNKLYIVKIFYYYYNLKKSKNDNIFDLIDFKSYSLNLISILENYEDVSIIYDTNNLYQIKIDYNKKYFIPKIFSIENKNFIQKILAIYLNKVIDILYDRQESDYYLRKYNL